MFKVEHCDARMPVVDIELLFFGRGNERDVFAAEDFCKGIELALVVEAAIAVDAEYLGAEVVLGRTYQYWKGLAGWQTHASGRLVCQLLVRRVAIEILPEPVEHYLLLMQGGGGRLKRVRL